MTFFDIFWPVFFGVVLANGISMVIVALINRDDGDDNPPNLRQKPT